MLLEALLDVALDIEDLLFHRRVPVVLDRVVCATLEILGNDGPLVLAGAIQDVQDELLFKTPLILLDSWIQVVVPALAALLADAPRQVGGDVSPLHGASGLHERED